MNAVQLHALRVPGATLHCEARGAGPPLLMIAAGASDARAFAPVAARLARRYTVLTYDPRGNSRSRLDGPPGELRVAVGADDARRLLEQVAGGPAFVFGSSSGALVALDLVARFPGLVLAAVVHEPPVIGLLAGGARHQARFDEVYRTYRRDGAAPAMRMFQDIVGLATQPSAEPDESQMDNRAYFLEHELRAFSRFLPDLAALERTSSRIVVVGGEESTGHLPFESAAVLAERLGKDVLEFPGGHIGYLTYPVPFASRLAGVLAGYENRPQPSRSALATGPRA